MVCAISDLQVPQYLQPAVPGRHSDRYLLKRGVSTAVPKNLNIEYILQNRLTVLRKTKRNCGGTSAKLIICAGVYTALYVRRVCEVVEKIDR
jgi:hypothetical protein